MTATDIEKLAVEAIARQKALNPDAITLDSRLQDLGISSLDAITIVYEIEEAFGVEVPTETLASLQTVQNIVDGIAVLVASKH